MDGLSNFPFARTSPRDHQSVAPSILALYRGSITVRERRRVSVTERVPIACLPLHTRRDAWLRLSLGAP